MEYLKKVCKMQVISRVLQFSKIILRPHNFFCEVFLFVVDSVCGGGGGVAFSPSMMVYLFNVIKILVLVFQKGLTNTRDSKAL